MKKIILQLMVLLTTLVSKSQVPVMGAISGPSVVTLLPPIGPISYSVTASNSPTSYTWTVFSPSTTMFPFPANIISGQGTSSIDLHYSVCGQNMFTLTCVASNSNGVSTTPAVFQSTVSEQTCNISFNAQLLTPTICFGNSFTAVAYGALNYYWSANTTETITQDYIPQVIRINQLVLLRLAQQLLLFTQ
jgi:hypothetical protein